MKTPASEFEDAGMHRVPPSLDGELAALAGATNYRDWLFSMTAPHMGGYVVEVGAGFGTMTHCLEDRERVVAIELLPHYVAELQRRYAGSSRVEVYQGDATDPRLWDSITARGPLDSAMSFNVLEHIEDDAAVLRNIWNSLAPGGRMVIFTPAFPRLYGAMDAAVGHVRRYRRRELATKARTAGFRVLDCHFVNMPGFFLWYLNGRVLRSPGAAGGARAVRAFDRLAVPIVRRIERYAHPPLGQSLLLVGEKAHTTRRA
jgi:SAM-dependent methyltransferase